MRLLPEYLIKVLDEKKEILIRQLTIKKKASISRIKVQGEVWLNKVPNFYLFFAKYRAYGTYLPQV